MGPGRYSNTCSPWPLSPDILVCRCLLFLCWSSLATRSSWILGSSGILIQKVIHPWNQILQLRLWLVCSLSLPFPFHVRRQTVYFAYWPKASIICTVNVSTLVRHAAEKVVFPFQFQLQDPSSPWSRERCSCSPVQSRTQWCSTTSTLNSDNTDFCTSSTSSTSSSRSQSCLNFH